MFIRKMRKLLICCGFLILLHLITIEKILFQVERVKLYQINLSSHYAESHYASIKYTNDNFDTSQITNVTQLIYCIVRYNIYFHFLPN